MKIVEGMEVFTHDGGVVGNIIRVVLDPKSREVTHIVVEKGLLFKQDKIIPIGMLSVAEEGRLVIQISEDDLDKLPDFERQHFVELERKGDILKGVITGSLPALYQWYTPSVIGQPVQHKSTTYQVTEKRNEPNYPEGAIPLDAGAKVYSVENKEVG